MRGGSLLLFFALVLCFPLPSDQIGGSFLVCYFFLSFSSFICFFGCSDGIEREACVCDHGFERSDLCAEITIIIRRKEESGERTISYFKVSYFIVCLNRSAPDLLLLQSAELIMCILMYAMYTDSTTRYYGMSEYCVW